MLASLCQLAARLVRLAESRSAAVPDLLLPSSKSASRLDDDDDNDNDNKLPASATIRLGLNGRHLCVKLARSSGGSDNAAIMSASIS